MERIMLMQDECSELKSFLQSQAREDEEVDKEVEEFQAKLERQTV